MTNFDNYFASICQFHKNDSAKQKEIRIATEQVYRDLRDMMAWNLSKDQIVFTLEGYLQAVTEMMDGVQDEMYDNVDFKGYANGMVEYIANTIHVHTVVGLGGVMPIGKHIVADLQDRIAFCKGN